MEWIELEQHKPEHFKDVLGCHFHDNWVSIIYYDADEDKWFNNWDNTVECWPTHIIEIPTLPHSQEQ